jgi:hypothetical protein
MRPGIGARELGFKRQPAVDAVAEDVPVVSVAHDAGSCAHTRRVGAEAHPHGMLDAAFHEDKIVMRLGVELPAIEPVPR